MKKASLLSIILLLLASCSQGDLFSLPDSPSGKEVKVHLSLYSVPMKAGDVETRSSSPIDDESKITDIFVVQYADGKLLKSTYYKVANVNDVDIALMESKKSNIYFLANCSSKDIMSLIENAPSSEEDFKKLNVNIMNEAGFISNGYTIPSIPMQGSALAKEISASGSIADLSVILTRMLARVDLVYSITPAALKKFSLNTIRICNIPKQLYFLSSPEVIFPLVASSDKLMNFDFEKTVVNSTTSTKLTFYLPENRRGTSPTPVSSPKLKTGIPNATYFELVASDFVLKLYPGADMLNDYNIERNKRYTINVTLGGASPTDARIIEVPKSNCYLVNAGESVTIPISRANASVLGTQIPNIAVPKCIASVYWATTDKDLVSISNEKCTGGTFTVKTKANTDGNAVVCIRDGESKNILWSWHIWVSTTKPVPIIADGYTFMDRNLGASDVAGPGKEFKVCAGLQYQWGRKDPFLSAINPSGEVASMAYTNLGSPIGAQYNIKDETRMSPIETDFKSSVMSPITLLCNWKPFSFSEQPWDAFGHKSVYDPCPVGWRVPRDTGVEYKTVLGPNNRSTNLNTNTSCSFQELMNGFGCYPACGFRASYGIQRVGNEGYYHVSMPIPVTYSPPFTGATLVITKDAVSSNYNTYIGCNIRCVKE